MSTQEIRSSPVRHTRTQRTRKPALNVDLNVPPPVGNQGQDGPLTHNGTQVQLPSGQGANVPLVPIDVEAFDDEVIISSPRAFAAAKNNSRRNHGRAIVVDSDSEDPPSRVANCAKRRRGGPNQTVNNCEIYVILEGSSSSGRNVAPAPPPPPPPVKELTFNCPVCMGALVEEMSTKCGHIFCKKCIKAAIAVQNKCPTCRKKVTVRELIRVYLPAAT